MNKQNAGCYHFFGGHSVVSLNELSVLYSFTTDGPASCCLSLWFPGSITRNIVHGYQGLLVLSQKPYLTDGTLREQV